MSKPLPIKDNIVENKDPDVAVRPSETQFSGFGITPPSEFALYGKGSRFLFESEVDKVVTELRETAFNNETTIEEIAQLGEPINEEKETPIVEKKKKAVNGASVFGIITMLLIIAISVLGHYVVSPVKALPDLMHVIKDTALLGMVFDFINIFLKGSKIVIVDIVLLLAAVLFLISAVATLISAICTVKNKGAKVNGILSFINFVFGVLIAVMSLTLKMVLPVGYYILFGLSFVTMMVFVFSASTGKRVNKKIAKESAEE